jgi:hypothetical protein
LEITGGRLVPRPSPAGLRSALALLLAALCFAPACAELRLPGIPTTLSGRERLTQADLREALADFAGRFAAVVSDAADEIHRGTQDLTLRRRTLLWKIRMVPLVQEAAFSGDAREAYVSVLTIAVLMRQYLNEGDGRDIFGELQPTAASAARDLEEEARRIGGEFLTPADLDRVTRQVEEFARRRSIHGKEFDAQAVHLALVEVHTGSTFAWIVDLPMSPFRALEGVSSGAQAIHEFNQTALAFSQIVEGLPQQIRWQSELLLYDVEERETLIRSLAAFQTVAESAARASAALEALPADLRLGLEESEGALARANDVLTNARALVGPLEETAAHVERAGEAWAGIFQRDGEPRQQGPPFDITQWQAAAREIGATAGRLADLTVELRGLVESQPLDATLARVSTTVELAETSAQEVVDAAAWRGLQLLVAFFVLLVAYRLLAARLPRPRP